MARRFESIWPIEPHTLAKHEILRHYLNAWLPIMASWNGRVLYIDGFAGPGRYLGGEPGSPIVALKAAIDHSYPIKSELVFLFIEADEQRKGNLEQEVADLTLPKNVGVRVHLGKFDDTIKQVLDDLDRTGGRLAPTFAFVDPFGWSHTPFDLIKRLLANPRCEVLINFMYEDVNRFISHPGHPHNFDRLFGTPDWRTIVAVQGSQERRTQIHDLYRRQLHDAAGARYVRSFEMRNRRNSTDYYLFFATNSQTGLAKMKEAMWRVDPSGSYFFSDVTATDQPVLFQPQPNFVLLRRLIADRFTGQTVDVEDVEKFVVEDTAFLDTHYKRRVLSEMERQVPPTVAIVSALQGESGEPFRRARVCGFLSPAMCRFGAQSRRIRDGRAQSSGSNQLMRLVTVPDRSSNLKLNQCR